MIEPLSLVKLGMKFWNSKAEKYDNIRTPTKKFTFILTITRPELDADVKPEQNDEAIRNDKTLFIQLICI